MDAKHYYLSSGQIMFKGEGDAIVTMLVNGIVALDIKNIGATQIAEIQQSLQINLFQRLGEPVEVVGVVIMTTNYLGQMTDKQFNNLKMPSNDAEPATAEGSTLVQ